MVKLGSKFRFVFILVAAFVTATIGYYAFKYEALTLKIKLTTERPSEGQVFFNSGAGYNEFETVHFKIESGRATAYTIQLPRRRIDSIRLDPMTAEGLFEIEWIGIERGRKMVREWKAPELCSALVPLHQVEVVPDGIGMFKARSTGNDPYLELKIPPAMNLRSTASRATIGLIGAAAVALLLLLYGAVRSGRCTETASLGRAGSMRNWDIALFSLTAIACFFLFQHGDITHTGGSSIAYLNGHIYDFYDVNKKTLGGGHNYLPSTYILFAIWNIPVRALKLLTASTMDVGYLVFWFKLLTTLFYFGSAYLIFRIGRQIGMDRSDATLMSAFWITTPIAFFSQFLFGQSDSFTLFFMLLGFLFYLRREMPLFILFFAIAATFKYFPVFVFAPLVLLAEKRPAKIVLSAVLFALPALLEFAFYSHSPGFQEGIFGFEANQRFMYAGFQIYGGTTLSLFLLLWSLLCGAAFLKNTESDRDFYRYALYIGLAAVAILFGLIFWHPQWLLFLTPFLAITTFLDKRARVFIWIDLLMMYFFVGYAVNAFSANVDQTLWRVGILGKLGLIGETSMMKDLFFPTGAWINQNTSLFFSLFAAGLLLNLVFKFPGRLSEKDGDSFSGLAIRSEWNLVRVRFYVGILIFIIPAVICLLK